ncbi:MAG: divergent polysaccharide deacetylase family protein [Pseudohongiellaceae bacterium]
MAQPRSVHLVIRALLAPGRRQSILLLALLILGTLLLLAFTAPDPGQPRSDETVPPATGVIERAPAPLPDTGSADVAGTENPAESDVQLLPLPLLDAAPPQGADVVLIIDDLGNNLSAGQRALALPAGITFAVLPHTPHARTLAEQAHAEGKEVMLHAPMSNLSRMPLGRGGLTPDLDKEEFRETLEESLAAVPHIRGVNNHTGSDLTAREQPMQWLMETLGQRHLYFVDSVTTHDSVAGDVAEKAGIPVLRRHVFLDNSDDPADIDREFRRLLDVAGRKGLAVGIGHPYPETLTYLETALPLLDALGYRLRFVSEMLPGEAIDSTAPLLTPEL